MPQGLFHFPGISQILSAEYTLSHGIAPGTCTIYVPPETLVPEIGELRIAYGDILITFQNCKLDRFVYMIGGDGKRRLALYILDRRWKWSTLAGGGQISGYYNTRRNDDEIVAGTEKNARELCEMLFEAMGETNFDASQVPDDQYPSAAWDYAHPPEELAKIAEGLGLRVVLGLDDVVRILPLGEGLPLPLGADVLEPSLAIDIPELPSKIVAVAGKTRFQVDLELEAVAQDVDGKIVLVREHDPPDNPGLSYYPADDLLLADLAYFLNITDLELRQRAQESVLRWYRIKEPFTLPQIVDDEDEPRELTRVDILPIETEQVETFDNDGVTQNLPAWVYGKFYVKDASEAAKNNVVTVDPARVKPGSPAYWGDGFSIDRELGIVKLSRAAWKVEAVGDGHKNRPAEMFLRVAVSLRKPASRAWEHHERERELGELDTEPRYVVKPDVVLNIKSDDEDNLADVNQRLDYYLDAIERTYDTEEAGSITYIGFKEISPDGAIRQVSWSVGEDGKAFTRASRNREDADIDVTYAQRRLMQNTAAAIREREREAAQREADKGKAAPKSA